MNFSKYDTIIIEGPDRVGKNSQIEAIRNHFSADLWQVLHYSKPPKLDNTEDYISYQSSLFNQMFGIATVIPKLILNRSHIGEAVYASYRGYDGSYIFDIEKTWMDDTTDEKTCVIVLVTDAEQLVLRDDGDSFYKNVEDAKSEVGRFIAAYHATSFTNKHLINVSSKTIKEVTKEIVNIL